MRTLDELVAHRIGLLRLTLHGRRELESFVDGLTRREAARQGVRRGSVAAESASGTPTPPAITTRSTTAGARPLRSERAQSVFL